MHCCLRRRTLLCVLAKARDVAKHVADGNNANGFAFIEDRDVPVAAAVHLVDAKASESEAASVTGL